MNDTMLEFLEKLFMEREIFSFDAKGNRIMCFPHTINITVQHVLKRMSSVSAPEDCKGNDDSEDVTGASITDEGSWFWTEIRRCMCSGPNHMPAQDCCGYLILRAASWCFDGIDWDQQQKVDFLCCKTSLSRSSWSSCCEMFEQDGIVHMIVHM